VSDQDFNFAPPPRREAKKAFEPPPWERDQFEELARRKEAEKAAAETVADAVRAQQAAAAVPETAPLPAATSEIVTPVPENAPGAETADVGEDPRIEAMLLGLRSEDPPFGTDMWKVAIAAGAVLASVGAVMTVWGGIAMAAARRTGVTGSLGGGILVVFGLGFVVVGAWMAFRTLREQGVL